MCRRYSGPRCSPDSIARVETAQKHLSIVLAEKATLEEKRAGGGEAGKRAGAKLRSKRFKTKVKNAENRIAFAEKHLAQTPAGVRDLREKAAQAAAAGDLKTAERFEEQAVTGKLQRAESYKDLRLGGNEQGYLLSERSRARALASTQNGASSFNKSGIPGHDSRELQKVVADMDTGARREFAEKQLVEWKDSDYERAHRWAEEGHRATWQANPNTRSKVKNVKERHSGISKVQRLNMPDGQVVESRADINLYEQKDGNFVVASRFTTASSWEDSSPIHRVNVPVGSYLASEIGQSKKDFYEETSFKTKAEAEAHIKKERRRLSGAKQAEQSARVAREGYVNRLLIKSGFNKNTPLSRFSVPVWPRYKVVETA